MRAISDEHAHAIKAATAAGIEALGGVRQAASLLKVGSSTLSKYASTSPEWADSFIRLDLAVEIDRRTPHAFLHTAMSRLVQNKPVSGFGEVTASAILRLDGVLDDVVREIAQAIEDGHVDARERQAVRAKIIAAKQELARLDALMVGGAG
ncbi:hypothetical protein BJF92_12070 [Rhizobium rhizosphaerae]|uniref:Uncharacterized protein n=1 Tax=Xaviernesmea rhizosphaerae TaxID=1672749 RepID=A0A1Q9ANP7_9HYPH|nr:hypothetical protein [Xaviernesmea rhizosphaerae]OLP56946.1 hypothetical protein BJF92_12070 [Xaviernesmea rhizosphaerae]